MKKVTWILVTVIIMVGLIGVGSIGVSGASSASQSGLTPSVTIITPVVPLDKSTKMVILGAGFEPGEELNLVIDTGGLLSDISSGLNPDPVANEKGAFITTWTCSRYVSKKVVKHGVYSLIVADDDYDFLAWTPFAFYDTSKPAEEWPSWATVIGGSE